jgi:hypothetical protein
MMVVRGKEGCHPCLAFVQRRQVRRDEALEGRDKESEVACARGVADVTIGGQGIVTQPDMMHMKSASPQSLRCTITDKHRILEPRDKKGDAPSHGLHREHPHTPRPSLTGLGLAANDFDEWREEDLD